MSRLMTCLTRTTCRIGLLLFTGTGIVTAAELPAAPERYEVELIIFRHIDQRPNTPEVPAATSIFRPSPLDLTLPELPPQTPEMPAAPLTIPGALPGDTTVELTPQRPPINFHLMALDPTYPDFVPLRDDRRSLSRVYERLERIDAYEPILHIGWVQPARESDNSNPYRFEPSAIDTTGLVGTITLYKERFLHLDINLSLESQQATIETGFFLDLSANDVPEAYTLTESRRIRGSTEHYFDHPRFGIIARIRDVKSAAIAREENG